MTSGDTIQVEVVFGLPGRQTLVSVNIDPASSCSDAINHSGIATVYPEFDMAEAPVAIWGRPAGHNDILKDGDRVEVLRPLEIDPRDARRRLAIDGQFMGAGPDDEPKTP